MAHVRKKKKYERLHTKAMAAINILYMVISFFLFSFFLFFLLFLRSQLSTQVTTGWGLVSMYILYIPQELILGIFGVENKQNIKQLLVMTRAKLRSESRTRRLVLVAWRHCHLLVYMRIEEIYRCLKPLRRRAFMY